MNRLLKAFGMDKGNSNPDSDLRAELDALRSEVAAFRQHVGWIESHHGDTLTDLVGRLNQVESGHARNSG